MVGLRITGRYPNKSQFWVEFGKYFVEEQEYKRNSDCEINKTTVDSSTKEKCGELKVSYSNKIVD